MITFKKITKDDILGFKPTVDDLSIDDFTSPDLLQKLELTANISIEEFEQSLKSNKVDNLDILMNHDFESNFFNQEFSESLNGFSNFVNYEVLSIGIELNNTFNPKMDMNNLVDAINDGIKERLISYFGKNEAKVLAAIQDDKDEENSCNIENSIRGMVRDRITEDYNGTILEVLLNSQDMPANYNTNEEPKNQWSHLNKMPLNNSVPSGLDRMEEIRAKEKIFNESEEMFSKISDDTGLILDFEVNFSRGKSECKIKLSAKGDNYLQTVLKEETNSYYKSLGLDPKTHYKKEKKTTKLKR
jgi:hypothetical protein